MNRKIDRVPMLALALTALLTITGASLTMAAQSATAGANAAGQRPQGPCDIYAAAGDPCVAAHSTTRALYAAYNGPLYQVLRLSDRKALDIGVVPPRGSDSGGYADAAAQDAFCANTYCWITVLYDQSGKHNHLTQAPRGGPGRVQQTAGGGHGADYDHGAQGLRRLHRARHGVADRRRQGHRGRRPGGGAVLGNQRPAL
jgi:hypothetical protein